MTIRFDPSEIRGRVTAPPSKSMAHRLLICAAQTMGRARVRGVAPSDDLLATVDCLRALGVQCELRDGDAYLTGYTLHCGEKGAVLPCRESASTLRFFLPLCLFGPPMTLTGSARLLRRPLGVYEDLCRRQGIDFRRGADFVRVRGTLRPGTFRLPGDVSSQFVSGLLFALPRLAGDSVISLRPALQSRGYVDMTMDALRAYGVETQWLDRETISVPGRQHCAFRADARAEGDWSNAAPLLALGAEVSGLDPDSRQGDRVCLEYLDALRQGPATLELSDCPDLGPLLFACAALSGGGRFTGVRRLRFKESDRVAAMAEELRKFGVTVAEGEDSLAVSGGARAPAETLDGHGDHRVVMALAVLCCRLGGTIRGAEAVEKSYPDFFETLRRCGARWEEADGQ